MKNNNKNKQIKYVKYYKNLANSELADIKTTQAAEINYLGKRDGAGIREYSEADAFLADAALYLLAAGAEKNSAPLYQGMKLEYEVFSCSAAEFRSTLTGGIIPRRSVEHIYQKTEERQKANNLVKIKNKFYKAAGFMLKEIGPEQGKLSPENIKEKKIILVFPPFFLTGAFFFAPSKLQAKIRYLRENEPELFYKKDSRFQVTETMARKMFLYIGIKDNHRGNLHIDMDEFFRAIRPSMFLPSGKCRSISRAAEMFNSLVKVYNRVLELEPDSTLSKIIDLTEAPDKKGRFKLIFQSKKKKKSIQAKKDKKRQINRKNRGKVTTKTGRKDAKRAVLTTKTGSL